MTTRAHASAFLPLLTVLACGDKDADDTAGGGGDSYFDASGTFDSSPFMVHCDEAQLLGASSGGAEPSINLICTDLTSYFSVAVAAIGPVPGETTTCSVYSGAQVTNASTGGYYACAVSGADSFSLDLTQVDQDGAGNVTWAGTFEMSGDDGTHRTSVSGSFRGPSRVP
ncbi:hypothetical protein L6R53_06870 [Myxococcota bacterium]|nr:hypothetical protein [Myxococcota bacterium]